MVELVGSLCLFVGEIMSETCAYCKKLIKQGERHPTTVMPYHCKCIGKAAAEKAKGK